MYYRNTLYVFQNMAHNYSHLPIFKAGLFLPLRVGVSCHTKSDASISILNMERCVKGMLVSESQQNYIVLSGSINYIHVRPYYMDRNSAIGSWGSHVISSNSNSVLFDGGHNGRNRFHRGNSPHMVCRLKVPSPRKFSNRLEKTCHLTFLVKIGVLSTTGELFQTGLEGILCILKTLLVQNFDRCLHVVGSSRSFREVVSAECELHLT